MEKAKINIIATKKGYDVQLVFENGKKIKISNEFGIPGEANMQEAEVLREDGNVIKIIIEGKEYKRENSSEMLGKDGTTVSSSECAHAPYNFIPLNDIVVPGEEVPAFDRYYKDRCSGFIDFNLKTITPLYIRKESGSSDFFSIKDKVKIPGSSLRGMIRTIVEIAAFGKFNFVNDSRFYFRSLADRCKPFKDYYTQKICNRKAGYLVFENDKYYIQPAKDFEPFEDTSREFEYEFDASELKWKIWSGRVGDRKRNNWKVFKIDSSQTRLEIPEEDIDYYKNDKNRGKKVNELDILTRAKDKTRFGNGVPVFYSEYNDSNHNKRIAFGHTAFFRLPYEKTVLDHVPDVLRNKGVVDISEAIFGVENKFASRVFFEDLELNEGQKDDIFLPETSPKILREPKPTTFQHYLEQNQPSDLKHWDSGAKIRGYKLYWHRNTSDNSCEQYSWDKGEIKNDDDHTIIKPVKRNVGFSGRVRFENLSTIELGALLFALELPEGCLHKIGMGKPLGLGSVEIAVNSLNIINRERRYSSLFKDDSSNWELGLESGETSMFKNVFNDYVMGKINSGGSLWDTPRMKLLKCMLSWDNNKDSDWLEKTRYMTITPNNEFRDRKILPSPCELCKNKA